MSHQEFPQEKKRYKAQSPGQAIYPRTQKHFHYNVARMWTRRNGKRVVFELDIDPSLALAFRHGKLDNVREALRVQRVFSDVSTARFAKESDLKEVFGTTDALEIAQVILQNGKIQPTAEEERRLYGEKKNRIVSLLRKAAVEAKTKQQLSAADIERIMKQAKIKVDLHEPDAWLIRRIIEAAQGKLLVGMVRVAIAFAPEFVTAAKQHLQKTATIVKEETLPSGQWRVTAEVPIGVKEDIILYFNTLTHGKCTIL